MLQLSKKFPKKRAFITGAGSGLGRELAQLLAADSWQIGITDIHASAIQETSAIIHALGGKAYPFVFDVSDRHQYEIAFKQFLHSAQGIDLLINNAGVGDGGLFEEYSLNNWEWITGINQMAVIYGCHLAVPVMKEQKSGLIINIASAAAFACMPNMSMYNVTKAAVLALSESLYPELAPFGVGIAVVMPTFFRSNIMQHNRGPESATSIGKILAEKAPIPAAKVAQKVLVAAGKGNFHILFPFQSRLVWYVKRWFPAMFLYVKKRGFQNKEWVIRKIEQR
ncbi:MAG: SDR family NAD(P)-dependent oxidoreductase [Chitinophagales bacterium]